MNDRSPASYTAPRASVATPKGAAPDRGSDQLAIENSFARPQRPDAGNIVGPGALFKRNTTASNIRKQSANRLSMPNHASPVRRAPPAARHSPPPDRADGRRPPCALAG